MQEKHFLMTHNALVLLGTSWNTMSYGVPCYTRLGYAVKCTVTKTGVVTPYQGNFLYED